MADMFKDIVNNENFGKLYQSNSSFRGLISDYIGSQYPNVLAEVGYNRGAQLGKILPKLQYRETSEGVGFFYEPAGTFFAKQEGEQLFDTLNRATTDVIRRSSAFTSSKEILGKPLQSPTSMLRGLGGKRFVRDISRTGPYTLRRMEQLAEEKGLTITRQTLGQIGAEELEDIVGKRDGFLLGLALPDNEVTTLLRFTSRATGEVLNEQQISDILGIKAYDKGPLFKRLKATTNERAIEAFRLLEPDGAGGFKYDKAFKAVTFDSTSLFKSLPFVRENIDKNFEYLSEKGLFDNEDFINQVLKADKEGKPLPLFKGKPLSKEAIDAIKLRESMYEKALDGMSFVTENGRRKMVDPLVEEIKEFEDYLKKAKGITATERAEITGHIADLKKQVEKLDQSFSNGGFNIRGNTLLEVNLKNFHPELGDRVLPHLKGDVPGVFISADMISKQSKEVQDIFNQIAEMAGFKDFTEMLVTDSEKGVDVIVPRVNVKTEAGVRAMTYLTLEPYPEGKRALVNIMTSSSFGDLINPDDFLSQSLASEIKTALTAIDNGIVQPGLINMIKDIANEDLDDFTLQERAARVEAQKYARQVLTFLDTGGDLTTNPSMTSKLLNIIQSENFAYMSRRYGDTITMSGKRLPLLGLKMPMAFSTRAQIVPTTISVIKSQTGMDLIRGIVSDVESIDMVDRLKLRSLGFIGVNSDFGRFEINDADLMKHYKAFGGFDLDDKLYSVYRYDSSAKRLLSLVYRDPNEVGEFAVFDASISMDKNFPAEIRALDTEKRTLLAKLSAGKSKATSTASSTVQDDLQRLNEINNTLDKYFNGESVSIGGKEFRSIDLEGLTKEQIDLLTPEEINRRRFIKQINIAEQLSSGAAASVAERTRSIYAPSGFSLMSKEELEKSLAEEDIFRSMRTVDYSGITDDAIQNVLAKQLERDSGIYRFRGYEYSEYLKESGYFKYNIAEEVEKQLKKYSGKLLTAQEMGIRAINKARFLEGSGSILGQTINQLSGIIDPFIVANEDLTNVSKVFQQMGLLEEEALSKAAIATKEFKRLLSVNQFERIEREAIIDLVTKEGEGGTEKVRALLKYNYENLGKIMGEYRKFLQAQGITMDVGLDPYLYQTRFSPLYEPDFLRGYNEVVDESMQAATSADLFLKETDQRAMASRLYKDVIDERTKFIEVSAPDALKKTVTNLSNQLDQLKFQAEASEIISARKIINRYGELERIVASEATIAPEERLSLALELLEGPESDYSKVSLKKGLGFINQELEKLFLSEVTSPITGKIDERRAQRVLLATLGQLSEDAQADKADIARIFGIRNLISAEIDGIGMGDRLNSALMKAVTDEGLRDMIPKLNRDDVIRESMYRENVSEYITRLKDKGYIQELDVEGKVTYRTSIPRGMDRLQAESAMLRQLLSKSTINPSSMTDEQIEFISRLTRRVSKGARSITAVGGRTLGSLGVLRDPENIKQIIEDLSSGETDLVKKAEKTLASGRAATYRVLRSREKLIDSNISSVGPTGTVRYAEREIADATSYSIVDPAKPKPRIANFSDKFAELLKEPFFRKGLMAGGIFAAIGIGYGVMGGRTPEDIQGPPLLPGGSAYESYDANSAPNMSSIYSVASSRGMNPGSLYKVNVTGISDPEAFRGEVARITGSTTSSTIYNNRRTINQSSNSRDTLNRRLGM